MELEVKRNTCDPIAVVRAALERECPQFIVGLIEASCGSFPGSKIILNIELKLRPPSPEEQQMRRIEAGLPR